jgi:hypothetical protein
MAPFLSHSVLRRDGATFGFAVWKCHRRLGVDSPKWQTQDMVGSPKKRARRRALPPPGQRILSLPQLDRARSESDSHFAPYIPEPLAIVAHKFGRPTQYKSELCQVVIDDAVLGHTIGATAALIGVARSTLSDWAAVHSEFAEALALAKGVRQRMYEGHLIDMVRRGGDSTRMSAVKLGLLNVGGEDWKERLTGEHNVTISLASLVEESMKLAPPVFDVTPQAQPDTDDGPQD